MDIFRFIIPIYCRNLINIKFLSAIKIFVTGSLIALSIACSHTPEQQSVHDDAVTAMIESMNASSNFQTHLHSQLDQEKNVYPSLAYVYDDIKRQFDIQTTTNLLVPIYKNYFSVDDARIAQRYFSSELGNKMTHFLQSNMSNSQIEKMLSKQEMRQELSYAKMRFKDPGVWFNISADFETVAGLTIQNMLSKYMQTEL